MKSTSHVNRLHEIAAKVSNLTAKGELSPIEKDLVKAYLLQMYDLLMHAPAAETKPKTHVHSSEQEENQAGMQTEIPLLNDIPEVHNAPVTELPDPEPESEPEEEPVAEPEPEIVPEEVAVSEPAPGPEEEPEPVNTTPAPEEPEAEPAIEEKSSLHSFPHEQEELTLNEKLSQAQDKKALLDKLMHTPIDNIKSHITLNKKVAFIIGLFNQEGDDYNKAIEELNTAENLQDAMDMFHVLKTKYNWNPQQDLVKELEILVRRRYSAGS